MAVVLPTHVGVSRLYLEIPPFLRSPPHARGGEPRTGRPLRYAAMSSPRTWG